MKPVPLLFVLVLVTCSLNAQQKPKPSAAATKSGAAVQGAKPSEPADLSILKKWKSEERSVEIDHKALRARIMKLVGTRYTFMKKLVETGGPATSVEGKGDVYSGFVCKAHDCADNNFIVAGDVKNNILHVGIRENGKTQVYSENSAPVPQVVTEWLSPNN